MKHPTVALDASFDIFPDLLFLVTPDGVILDYRGGRYVALYAPPDAFLQRSMHAVLPPPVAAQFAEAIARVCDTQSPASIDYALPMPDGEHAFEARLVPLVPEAILAICRDVTETLRVKERLETARRLEEARRTELVSLLEATLDSTADGILVVDRHGRFATFNRQFVTMWRIPRAIIDARDRDRALAFAVDQLVEPDAFAVKIRELYASPDAESFDVLTFKDGRTFERYSRPQYVDGNCVGRVWSFRDVTSRMRAEAALQESEQRFRQLAESIDQVFWLRDTGTERFLYVSPAFESILGRPVEDLYANPRLWIESIDPLDRPQVLARYDAWLNGETTEPTSLTYRIVRPDGTIRWLFDRVTPIKDPHGRVYRVGGVAKDITARQDADDARRQFEAQLLQAQKMEALGTLASGIAHNFNNALAVIIGNTEIARRLAPTDPAVRESLEAVLTASAQAQTLVRRIDTFARPHAGQRRTVNFGPLVQEAVGLLEATLPATVRVALTVDPDTPAVLADPTEIEQLVLNLVSNAAQAVTGPATVEIAVGRLDASPERVESEPDLRVGPYATISVTDRGAGMDGMTKRRVFEPFFTTKAPGEGTGLGLSVVHGIVTRLGGTIRVWSERGVGSRFEVYVPAPTAAVTLPELSLASWRILRTSRPNVLIEGPEAATEAVLDTLTARCAEPVAYWGDTLGDQRPPTLIVRDVAALTATDQQRLLRWLERGERSQILSTTAQPLFALVERGLFLRDLFYRLNVVRLDVQQGVLLEEPEPERLQFEWPLLRRPIIIASEHERKATVLAARFGGLLDAAPDATVVVSLDGRILIANQHALTLFGYEAKDLIGQLVETLVPERFRDAHVGHRRQFENDPETRPMGASLDLQGRRKDGSEFSVEISLSPLDFEEGRLTIVAIRDSSYRRKIEAKFRGLLEAAPDAMIVADRDGRILLVNSETERLFGYPREELIGQPVEVVVPSDVAAVHPSHRARYVHDPHRRPMGAGFDLRGRRKDGTEFPVEISLSPLETEDGLLITTAVRDMTDRRRLEEALRHAQRLDAIGRLAGGIAHDFNNILTAIEGYSRLVLDGLAPDAPLRADAEEIERAAQRAALLTRRLLAFGRRQTLQPRVVDLNALVRDLENFVARIAGEDIRFVTSLDPSLGAVRADPSQLEQVLMNLVVNARDAMPSGGTLTIATANVDIDDDKARKVGEGLSAGQYVGLTFSDTGAGMNEEILSRIFEPFFTTKDPSQGTGLGLSTVYGIVKQSGGDIDVESEPGRGTTFRLYLPRVEASITMPKSPDQHPSSTVRGSETILLVEDEPAVRDLVRRALERNGYQVLHADNGDRALELAAQYEGTIHLLITDVIMPQMSGRELAARFQAQRPEARLLYMSGYTDSILADRGMLEAGVELLEKPFALEAAVRKVREILDA